MSERLIVDFDHTLVRENSSRVLERLILERADRNWRTAVWQFGFYSPIAIVINKLFAVGSALIGWRDLRLISFFRFLRPEMARHYDYAQKQTVNLLTADPYVAKLMTDDTTVLSSGLGLIIDRFLQEKHIKHQTVIASRNSNKGILLRVNGWPDKVSCLSGNNPVRYITDDQREVAYLVHHLRRMGREVAVKKITNHQLFALTIS